MRNSFLSLGRRHCSKVAKWLGHVSKAQKFPCKASQGAYSRQRLKRPIMTAQPAVSKSSIRIAIIGDVHGDWDSVEDGEALRNLHCDAAVFVGDFNEEDIPLLQKIAAVTDPPKAVILGNHDAWSCLTNRGKKINSFISPAGTGNIYSAVEQQLDILGGEHVGYSHKQFMAASGASFAIVGGRPFSKGGPRWADCKDFYMRMYHVVDEEESAKRIAETVLSLPDDAVPIVAAHNGPTGLGRDAWSICGVDFKPRAGDHGDRDLELALQRIHAAGRTVPLVVFGHMHEKLRGTSFLRNMVEVDGSTGTVYLNTAVVPRIRKMEVAGCQVEERHFCIAELEQGMVQNISNAWVSRGEDGRFSTEEQNLLMRGFSSQGYGKLEWYQIRRGYTKDIEVINVP